MAVAPLQIPGYAQPRDLDFSSLANLPQVYRQAQAREGLASLGQGLADGTLDFRQAAAKAAQYGDTDTTLKFLALDEQRRKQEQELTASNQFSQSLSRLYGGGPPAAAPSSTVGPAAAPAAVGVPAVTPPDTTVRAPVASTPKVWGDDEAVKAGIYDPPAQRTQVAQAEAPAVAPATGGGPAAGLPSGITPRAMALMQAASSPRLPQNQREFAKTLLTSELDANKATSEMREWAFAKSQDPNTPDFTTWTRANKAAGKTDITVDNRAENEENKAAGKAAGERRAAMFASAGAAPKTLMNLNRTEVLLGQVAQGKVEPARMTVSAWAKSLGLDDDVAARLGLDPKGVGSAQALSALANESVLGKIGAGGFPSNNFSNTDRQFLVDMFPKLGDDPISNKIKVEGARRIAQLDIDRAKAYQAFKQNPANKSKGFEDFELEFSEQMAKRDLFGDLRKEAEKIVGSAGAGTRPPVRVTTPDEARKLPSGTAIILPDGSTGRVP